MTAVQESTAAHHAAAAAPATEPGRSAAVPAGIVVAHGGARDAYQVALALAESGRLEALVTDLYWNPDPISSRLLPKRLVSAFNRRSAAGLRRAQVVPRVWSGLLATALERVRTLPLGMRRAARRFSDARIGGTAGRIARDRQARLLSYSYFGAQAFAAYGRPGMLFQVHPHPQTVRALLQEELRRNPQCAASLQQEWELALPARDFAQLVQEASTATHYLVASTFTRNSLVEHGVDGSIVSVVPYGIDLARFSPATIERQRTGTLQLLFVGRINQRKGLSYLLEALRLLPDFDVHLTICGRVVDDLSLFRDFADRITIRPSVSSEDLLQAYRNADLFVFPSIAEGFGQVLLEALACGVPIVATTHTAAPDLIEDGVQGFVVEPRRPDLLAGAIAWACCHRGELRTMGQRARVRAEQFTWARFRAGVIAAMDRCERETETGSMQAVASR